MALIWNKINYLKKLKMKPVVYLNKIYKKRQWEKMYFQKNNFTNSFRIIEKM